MDYLYGKLNNEVKYREYKGSETTTASVTIDDSDTVSVDVKRVPNELTLTTINGNTYTYDGSEPASFDIRTQVTDKVEEGNNLPVTSDAVKGYVDSKAGALEYVGGEGNFTNIDGGVTVKGRLNVDDGIYSPVTSDDPNFVPNNKSVDDKITASEQKLIDERIGAFTRTADKLFTDVTGSMTIKGHLNVDGGITSASGPTSATDVANKRYVDNSRLYYMDATSVTSAQHDDTGIHIKADATMRTKEGLDYQGKAEMRIPIVGKDGVTIEDDSDNIVAVKADVEAIQKDMAGRFGNNSLWYTSTTGEPSGFGVTDAGDSGAIPVITDGLRLPETIPNENYVAVHKKYVDDHFAPLLHNEEQDDKVYIQHGNQDGTSTTRLLACTVSPFPNFSVKRSATGTMKCATPAEDDDAATKKYVDGGFVAKQTITTPNQSYLYAYDSNGDKQFQVTGSPNAGSVPIRGGGGVVKVGAPIDVADATTKKYVDDADAKKLNLTGGTITGSLAIQGDLTVTGTTTTEKAQTLAVKDSVIITNADGAELGATLSGIAIRKDGENTYGVMYDPSSDSVKLGLGTLDAENKFTFNESGTDGKPIATRDDSSNLTDGDLVRWDGTTKSLVDSGKKVDDFVEKVTVTEGSNLAYVAKNDGTQGTLPVATGAYSNTLAQRTTNGRLLVGTAVEDSDAMPKKQVDDNFIPKSTFTDAWQVLVTGENSDAITTRGMSVDPSNHNIPNFDNQGRLLSNNPDGTAPTEKSDRYAVNVGYANTNYVAKIAPPDQFVYAYGYSGNTPVLLKATSSATANQLAYRGTGGVLSVGTPTEDAHATTKKYVDDNLATKQATLTFDETPTAESNNPVTSSGIKKFVDDGFVPKGDPDSYSILYGRGSDGAERQFKFGYNVGAPFPAYIDNNGNSAESFNGEYAFLQCDTDSAKAPPTQAVNLGYADEHYVAKVTAKNIAYTTDNDGKAITTHMSFNPTAWDLVTFDGKGCLRTSNPTGDDGRQCVNKQYADATYVKSVAGTTNAPVAYIRGQDGTDKTASLDSLTASQYSVAQRDINGNIKVGTATATADAVNKGYADDNYVAKIEPISQTTTAYVVLGDGTPSGIRIDGIAQPNSLAYRSTGGVVRVGTPVGDADATTKAYVDNLNTITITAGA